MNPLLLAKLWSLAKYYAGPLLLIGLIATLSIMLCLAKEDARHWEKKAANIQSAFDLTVANYRAASAESIRRATVEKATKEAQHAQIASRSDADYRDLRTRYDAAVGRLHGQATQANSGSTDRSNLRGNAQASGVYDEQANDTGLLISRADALICADNTAFAQSAFDWADRLATFDDVLIDINLKP